MKIAVTAMAPELDAPIDPRFGRCTCFLVIETEDFSFENLSNPNAGLGSGAGIQSAQLMAELGVTHVLTGNCGPNAHQALTAAGIAVVVGCKGRAREAVEQFLAGQLAAAKQPNVDGHYGMNGARPLPGTPAALSNASPGRGMGRGGRGTGGGRGAGGARGMSGGRGGVGGGGGRR